MPAINKQKRIPGSEDSAHGALVLQAWARQMAAGTFGRGSH